MKPKERKLSKFLAEEMLYDYVSQHLDEPRVQAMEEFLADSLETKELKNQMVAAIEYCQNLSQTQISEPMLLKLIHAKTIYRRIKDKISWSRWPDAARWTLEAVVISSLAAIVVIVLWPKLSSWIPDRSQEVILAEVDKDSSESKEIEVSTPQPETIAAEQSNAKETPSLAPDSGQPAGESSTEVKPATGSGVNVAGSIVERAQPNLATEASVEEKTVQSKSEATESQETSADVVNITTDSSESRKTAPKGVVYRATMNLDNIEVVSEQIRVILEGLGAEKAGDVRLGWRKPNGSYFHFSLPETNYEEVMQKLRTFGPVRISKDPHWRVMPEGKIRFILWVEDLAQTESTQEP